MAHAWGIGLVGGRTEDVDLLEQFQGKRTVRDHELANYQADAEYVLNFLSSAQDPPP